MRSDGLDGAARDQRRRLVHAVEGGHVGAPDAHGRRLPGVVAEGAHLLDEVAGVEALQLGVAGQARREQAFSPAGQRSRSMPGPKRRGVSGCPGPKS